MIEDYRGLAVFAAVAEHGSFSAAARRLKLSTSVVSHHVTKLETKLGAPLFFRSTRALSLTPEGTRILEAARRMVQAGEEALDALSDDAAQLVGGLRITLPAFGDNSPVHRKIWEFARMHPMVALSMHNSDHQADLVKEGFDLAIRLGTLSDSALKSRRIGTFQRVLAASPEYIASVPRPTRAHDLQKLEFIGATMLGDEITLIRRGETIKITPEATRIEVGSIRSARAAALAGLGYTRLPVAEVAQDLASGALVEVLPDWRLPDLGVFAVWPDSGAKKNLTRRMIDFMIDDADG